MRLKLQISFLTINTSNFKLVAKAAQAISSSLKPASHLINSLINSRLPTNYLQTF